MKARRYIFEGQVQGVGFRMTTLRLAKKIPIVGWVQNLPDGRVELFAQERESSRDPEAPSAILQLLSAIKLSRLGSLIRYCEEHEEQPIQELESFEIKR